MLDLLLITELERMGAKNFIPYFKVFLNQNFSGLRSRIESDYNYGYWEQILKTA